MMAGKLQVAYLLFVALRTSGSQAGASAVDSADWSKNWRGSNWVQESLQARVLDARRRGSRKCRQRRKICASKSLRQIATASQRRQLNWFRDKNPPTERESATVYTLVGRIGSPIRISLRDKERVLDELTLQPSTQAKSEVAIVPLAATSELLVSLGSAAFGLKDAFPNRAGSGEQSGRTSIELIERRATARRMVRLRLSRRAVPFRWRMRIFCMQLASDKTRFAALEQWVANGGRLVIFCGGDDAREMLGPGGPLASLVPGKICGRCASCRTQACWNTSRRRRRRLLMRRSSFRRLNEVTGNIEAYAGQAPTDLPLVIRAPRGFGEVTFVGVDFSRPPLDTWSGRNAFLHSLLRPYLGESTATDTSTTACDKWVQRSLGRVAAAAGPFISIRDGDRLPGRCRSGDCVFGCSWVRSTTCLCTVGCGDRLRLGLRFPLSCWRFRSSPLQSGAGFAGARARSINRIDLIDVDT